MVNTNSNEALKIGFLKLSGSVEEKKKINIPTYKHDTNIYASCNNTVIL